jgi:hypothetical protein
MIPAEKAKELLDKHWIYLRAGLLYDEEAKEDARHCALIAVDEIINTRMSGVEFFYYWQEVKVELEKL